MPCSPGLAPVIIELQEIEEIAGIEDFNTLNTPSRLRELKKGITPWLERSSINEKGTPSRPIITVRFLLITLEYYTSPKIYFKEKAPLRNKWFALRGDRF